MRVFWNILNYVIHGLILIALVYCCYDRCRKLQRRELSCLKLVKQASFFSYIAAVLLGAFGLIGLVLRLCDTYQLDFLKFENISGLVGDVLRSPWIYLVLTFLVLTSDFTTRRKFIFILLTLACLICFALTAHRITLDVQNAEEMQKIFYAEGSLFRFNVKLGAFCGYLRNRWVSHLICAFASLICGTLFRIVSRSMKAKEPLQKGGRGIGIICWIFALLLPLAGLFIVGPMYKQFVYGGGGLWEIVLSRKAILEYIPGTNVKLWQPLALAYGSAFVGVYFGSLWFGLAIGRRPVQFFFYLLIWILFAAMTVVCGMIVSPFTPT